MGGSTARILDYLEQANLKGLVDTEVAWDYQMAIDNIRIGVFQCPSELRSEESRVVGEDRPTLWPTNYGFCMGTWFVYDPKTDTGGDGVFYPNSNLPPRPRHRRHVQHPALRRGQGMDALQAKRRAVVHRHPQHQSKKPAR